MPLIASGALPVFERVTERAALAVLICWLPKATLVVDKLAIGAGGAAPVPERLTLCGLPAAPSVIVRVPARVPRAVGVGHRDDLIENAVLSRRHRPQSPLTLPSSRRTRASWRWWRR